jgi:hypothetical protein
VPRPQVLRSSLDTALYGLLALICGATAVAGLGMVLFGSNLGPGVGQFLLGMAGIAVVAAALLRVALLRVVLHDDHVQLVSPLRTMRIAWADVEDIDLISRNGWIVRVWAGGQPHQAWGLCKLGRFGLAAGTRHDDPEKDTPRWQRDGYAALRRYWRSHRRR